MKVTRIWLAAILLLGLFLRFWGIQFGLPHPLTRPDEEFFVNSALLPLDHFRPYDYVYPSLLRYILFFLYGLYFCIGKITGTFKTLYDFAMLYAVDRSAFYLIARALSAILGTACVYALFRLAKRFLSQSTALVSAFFLSVAYLHVRNSHFGVSDVVMTFFVVVAVTAIVALYQAKTLRSYCIAGIWAGLAFSIKYPAFVLVITGYCAHVMNVWPSIRKRPTVLVDKKIILFFILFALTFFLGTPFALIDCRHFLHGSIAAVRVTSVLGGTYPASAPVLGWWYQLIFTLRYGLGGTLFIASLIGIFLFLRRDWRLAVIVLSFPVLNFLVFGSSFIVMSRYMVPLVPFLCLTAGITIEWLTSRIAYPWRPWQPLFVIGAAGAVAFVPLVNSAQVCSLLAKTDTRILAASWFEQNAPAGSSVAQLIINYYARLELRPSEEYLRHRLEKLEHTAFLTGFPKLRIKYLLDHIRKTKWRGFNEWDYDFKTRQFKLGLVPQAGFPDYIAVIDEELPPEEQALLRKQYRLVTKFASAAYDDPGRKEDIWDVFFIPYVGFRGIVRPGPTISIYGRKQGNAR